MVKTLPITTSDVISPALYARILTDANLVGRLLPHGLLGSPYEVLNYTSIVTLDDPEGMHATIERHERIRFLQEGVSAILDHAWGDGVVMTSYQTNVGHVEGSLRDAGKRHLVLGLRRPAHRGEIVEFAVERKLVAAVTQNEEWLETVIDHPVRQIACTVRFPQARPCKQASLVTSDREMIVPVIKESKDVTVVQFHQFFPKPHAPYTLRWSW